VPLRAPFEQQKQLVRQHFRLREGGCGAQRRRKTTVTKIVVLTALALAFVAFEVGPEVAMAVY